MMAVIIACIPTIITQYYFFGIGNIIQIFIAINIAYITEACCLKIRKINIMNNLCDNSALLTAILLAMSIPPLSEWWLISLGTMFAIIFGKQLYGGIGNNIFNPSMLGYIFLLISFPIHMTMWQDLDILKINNLNIIDALKIIFYHNKLSSINIDAISQATPLYILKNNVSHNIMFYTKQIKFFVININYWQLINIINFCVGIVLLYKKIINWHIPISLLLSLIFFSSCGYLYDPLYFGSPITHLFFGSTMFGAFFIATDPVTASTTQNGRIIYGILIGFFLWLIRNFSNYLDGIAFAILLTNICVPIIDNYTQPKIYGYVKK